MPEVGAEIITLLCIAPATFLAYRFWSFRSGAGDATGPVPASGAVTGHAGAGRGE